MKKQLLIGTALFAAISAFPQNGLKTRPKPSGFVNMKTIAENKFGNESAPVTIPEVTPKKQAKTSVMNWQIFTGSMNIYGVVIGYSKPLQWNDELNAVTFIHRKSATYPTTGSSTNSESGSIVA